MPVTASHSPSPGRLQHEYNEVNISTTSVVGFGGSLGTSGWFEVTAEVEDLFPATNQAAQAPEFLEVKTPELEGTAAEQQHSIAVDRDRGAVEPISLDPMPGHLLAKQPP